MKRSLLLLLLTLTLFSCKDDDAELGICSSDSSPFLLKELRSNGSLQQTYHYNENSDLKTWITLGSNGNQVELIEFEYNNDNISEIIANTYFPSDTSCVKKSFFYNSSELLDKTILGGDNDCNQTDTSVLVEVNFFYNSDLKLDSSIFYHYGNSPHPFIKIHFYDNFERIESSKNYGSLNTNSDFSIEKYTYDNNPNPWFNSGFVGSVDIYRQKNNLIKITRCNSNGNPTNSIGYPKEFLFEYNSENYPINRKRTLSTGAVATIEFIYY